MGRPAPADDLIARFEREGIPGVLCKLSSTPGRIDRSVSLLGQYNREVYGRYLGLSEEGLARLREEMILHILEAEVCGPHSLRLTFSEGTRKRRRSKDAPERRFA